MDSSPRNAYERMWAAMLEDPSPSPRHKRRRTHVDCPEPALVEPPSQMQMMVPVPVADATDASSWSRAHTIISSSDARNSGDLVAATGRGADGTATLIEISSQENRDGGVAEELPEASALANSILSYALSELRGAKPHITPPFSMFAMERHAILSPRGVSFYPQLVDGSFSASKEAVESRLRSILNKRAKPIFYIGSTTDLIYRWRDLRDQHGRLAGHAFARNIRWHTMLVLYRTDNGSCCALMEEHLIQTFNRRAYAGGLCQNASLRALRVQKSLVATHWVYVCLPQC